ncbi:hypothetical protein EIP86_008469 [Pleurotus ostreatoroseus]|nr:hypothetical protein EIP86_008469 [Pleurotus ostreatoroseus]
MPGLPRANTPSKVEVPKGEADMSGFKRNITSARAFLEAIRDSCNDDPTILNFFMALMVSWKAQRISTEDLMDHVLFTLPTPALQDAFGVWLPRGFRYEAAPHDDKTGCGPRIVVDSDDAKAVKRDAVWAQAVGGVFLKACRELVAEERARATEGGDSGQGTKSDCTRLFTQWYTGIHMDVLRWAPTVAQFLARVLRGYRGGYDRRDARDKGRKYACPVATALMGEEAPAVEDVIKMLKTKLGLYDDQEDFDNETKAHVAEMDLDVDAPSREVDECASNPDEDIPDTRSDSSNETVTPYFSAESELESTDASDIPDTRALLYGLQFTYRLFNIPAIPGLQSASVEAQDSAQPVGLGKTEVIGASEKEVRPEDSQLKKKEGGKRHKAGKKHKRKNAKGKQKGGEETQQKRAESEHADHTNDQYLRFLDVVLMHAYELERSETQEEIDMWQELLFWHFEEIFEDMPEFVADFKKFWEAPNEIRDDLDGLEDDFYSRIIV